MAYSAAAYTLTATVYLAVFIKEAGSGTSRIAKVEHKLQTESLEFSATKNGSIMCRKNIFSD